MVPPIGELPWEQVAQQVGSSSRIKRCTTAPLVIGYLLAPAVLHRCSFWRLGVGFRLASLSKAVDW